MVRPTPSRCRSATISANAASTSSGRSDTQASSVHEPAGRCSRSWSHELSRPWPDLPSMFTRWVRWTVGRVSPVTCSDIRVAKHCACPSPCLRSTNASGGAEREAREAVLYFLMKWVFIGPLLRAFFRPEVEGRENIPADGGALLASNHLAVADSFFLPL